MKLKNAVDAPRWTEITYGGSHVVLSSRCRLARNFSGLPFSHRAVRDEKQAVLDRVRGIIEESEFFQDYHWQEMEEMDRLRRSILLEENVISWPHAVEVATGRGLAFNLSRTESIMVNEEDHLRFQVICPGLEMKKCWLRLNRIDDEIERLADYAFSTEFGYKTACPSNMGTGLRSSVMMHLPATFVTGRMEALARQVEQQGLVIRGMFGEGSPSMGNIIQLSNQESGGASEESIIGQVESAARRISDQELDSREHLLQDSREQTYDHVFRDLAILKNARVISLEELMDRLSVVRMGSEMGIIREIPATLLNQLALFARPAYLQSIYEPTGEAARIDIMRADLCREMLEDY